jgi:hypothetical protein
MMQAEAESCSSSLCREKGMMLGDFGDLVRGRVPNTKEGGRRPLMAI